MLIIMVSSTFCGGVLLSCLRIIATHHPVRGGIMELMRRLRQQNQKSERKGLSEIACRQAGFWFGSCAEIGIFLEAFLRQPILFPVSCRDWIFQGKEKCGK
jgi:hypothetical protein